MTEAEKAYELAEQRIAEVLEKGSSDLDLEIGGLETIPPRIADLREQLTRLDLSNTSISDAAPLANLTKLTWLDFSNTGISDAAPLASLTNLTMLDLRNTNISDAAPLTSLTKLTMLYLDRTNVGSAKPLSTLTNLETLSLTDTPMNDLRPLKTLDNLGKVNSPIAGLRFEGCIANKFDPKLKRLSEIEDNQQRTLDTLAYLKSLKEWPPVDVLPEDKPDTSRYTVPDNGPIQATGDPIGPNDPEQQALQNECREKIRALIGSVREGDNELADLVDNAKKYRNLIDEEPTVILASTLWSAANTLRARHEAHQSADEQARLNDLLPPATATALKDLLETHGIFFLGHPAAAEVERKRREFLSGPRNPEARGAAVELVASLVEAPKVLEPDAASPLALDAEAAQGEGPSAQMAETSLLDRLQNITGSVARKVWSVTKTTVSESYKVAITVEVSSWLIAQKSVLMSFYTHLATHPPAWLTWLLNLF